MDPPGATVCGFCEAVRVKSGGEDDPWMVVGSVALADCELAPVTVT